MKKWMRVVWFAALLLAGFVSGAFFQHARSRYRFTVLAEKEYVSGVGKVRWVAARESVGMPFLETETTMIEADGHVVYKAKRDFQEKSPYAEVVSVTNNVIVWRDGISRYELRVSDDKVTVGK
jgi:hypothetical protein